VEAWASRIVDALYIKRALHFANKEALATVPLLNTESQIRLAEEQDKPSTYSSRSNKVCVLMDNRLDF
jgi:hypothetical protein